MNLRTITPVLAAACLLTSLSVSAQMSSTQSSTTSTTSTSSESQSSLTCQEMMDRAEPTVDSMSDEDQIKAQREIERAKADMEDSKWNSCKSHMQKVLDMPNTTPSN